jgi:hypothetical protein
MPSKKGVAMRRRMIGLSGLLTASIVATGVGCESLRHSTRVRNDDKVEPAGTSAAGEPLSPTAVDGGARDVHAVDSNSKAAPSPFFKNNRKPGALSSEAREIERSLGVE